MADPTVGGIPRDVDVGSVGGAGWACYVPISCERTRVLLFGSGTTYIYGNLVGCAVALSEFRARRQEKIWNSD